MLKEQWAKVLSVLQNQVTAVTFDLWINTLEPVSYLNDEFVLLASSTSAKHQALNPNIYPKIQESVREVFKLPIHVKIIDSQELQHLASTVPTEMAENLILNILLTILLLVSLIK